MPPCKDNIHMCKNIDIRICTIAFRIVTQMYSAYELISTTEEGY